MAAPLCPSQQPIAGLPQRLWALLRPAGLFWGFPSSLLQPDQREQNFLHSPGAQGLQATGSLWKHKAFRTAEERASKDLCPDERGDRGLASALDLKLETVMWELPPTVIIPVVIAG